MNNETEIYYFSGTGNSLYVARELQKRIPDSTLIPIVSLLQKDNIKTNGKSIGFVFPVHALTVPIAVKRFIEKANLQSAEYIFAIATRYGTVFRGFEKINQLLRKNNKQLDSQFILNMSHNEGPRSEIEYKTPSESEILQLEKVVLEKLDLIKNVITTKSISHEKDTEYIVKSASNPVFGFLIERIVLFAMSKVESLGGVNYFCHDNNCNGCGICKKVCLSKKIKITNLKPVWQKNVLCYMCFACLNYCPKESVQINNIPFVKSYTKENGRYTHPYANMNDISIQKE